MVVKQVGKIILGADLNEKEKKALDIEIGKEFAKYNRNNTNEVDAIVLWVLHDQLGFGHDRLKKFHAAVRPSLDGLCERYEMTNKDDELWLCTRKLLDIGVDIEEWNKEVMDQCT